MRLWMSLCTLPNGLSEVYYRVKFAIALLICACLCPSAWVVHYVLACFVFCFVSIAMAITVLPRAHQLINRGDSGSQATVYSLDARRTGLAWHQHGDCVAHSAGRLLSMGREKCIKMTTQCDVSAFMSCVVGFLLSLSV